ncbi:MAG TPA: nucleotide exchange factor GrpE [Solirubrobacterales bacterium]
MTGQDESARPAGPVSDSGLSLPGESSESSPPAGDADQSEAQAVEADFDQLLADAQKEKEEYLELARRTKADFENFRKRVAADLEAAQVRGKVAVAREVIDAVDNLERALEAAGEGESLAAGVEMVLGGLRETLGRNGVEVVDPKGEKFDPTRHEALSTQPVEDAESGTVVEVLQKGYVLGEQLVRPARVVVSS